MSVLEAMPDAVGVYDAKGRMIFANAVAHELLGIKRDSSYLMQSAGQRGEQVDIRDSDGAPLSEDQMHVTRLLRGETITSEHPVETLFTNLDGSERCVSITGAPITDAQGTMLGAIAIARDITEQRRRDLQQADLMRRELEARAASEHAARELERLQRALDTALMRLSLDDLLEALLERASDSLKTDTATLLLLDEQGSTLTARAARGLDEDVVKQIHVPIGHGFAGRIAASGEPLYLSDTTISDVVSGYLREQLHSVIGVPMTVDGRLLGVLHVGSKSPREFSSGDIWLLRQIADRAAQAIDRAQLFEALQQAHREAAAQARQLDVIVEALSEGVILYGPDRSTLHANSAFRRMMGIAPGEDSLNGEFIPRGRAVQPRDITGELLPVDQWPATRVLHGEVIDSQHSQDIWLRSHDGRDALYSATGGPVYDEHGELVGAVMALRDVTAHRQLQREATDRAATLEAIIETMVDGLFVHDATGHILRVNSSGREHFGLAHDAALTDIERAMRTAFDGMPEDQWPTTRVLHGEALTAEHVVELPIRLPDGRARSLMMSGAPMRDARGQLLGAVMLTRDVTGLHALQHRTQQSLEALLEMAEAVLSVSANDNDDDSIARDATKRVAERLIELAQRVLGCNRMGISILDSETGKMRALAVAGLSPEDERRWWAEQEAAELYGPRLEDSPDQEVIQRVLAGETFTIDLRDERYHDIPNNYGIQTMLVAPMLVAQRFVGMITLDYAGHPHDFTSEELSLASAVSKLAALVIERDRMLRERAAAEATVMALAQANQRMDEFLGIAAHELRTPITVIKANLQMLLRRANRTLERVATEQRVIVEPQRAQQDADLLTRTERSLSRLTRLVDDLLDVSRVRAGKLELRIEPVELTDIVRDAVEEQRLAIPDRQILLELPRHQRTPVLADGSRVAQVVTNYLTNALKYSGAATPVRVRLSRDETSVYVSVADEGVGIPAAQHDQVWDLFHRIPGIEVISGSGIGLGLGLHLCKTIIERHGGQVGVSSQVGLGSTFWFTLPLRRDDVSA
ncbi:MAG TPA: GAF domain-containing protein [Ktedonobacterales bacterium]|nr:GAF domain-containing protein [Ktedonobacterales bacterium]